MEKIILDGKERKVFVCDRKAPCRKSKHCGSICTKTLDEKHAVKAVQLSIFGEKVTS